MRRFDQSAGAGAVHQECGVLVGADPQRRRDVVGPEVGAQRRHQQGVEYRLVQPAQPLDQREIGRLQRSRSHSDSPSGEAAAAIAGCSRNGNPAVDTISARMNSGVGAAPRISAAILR